MLHVYIIGGKPETIWDNESFARILDEKLGDEAGRFFRDALQETENSVKFDPECCSGECDRTYQIQEHYERIIADAAEDLLEIECSRVSDKKKLELVVRDLQCARMAKVHSNVHSVTEKVHQAVRILQELDPIVLKLAHRPVSEPTTERVDASKFAKALKLLEGVL